MKYNKLSASRLGAICILTTVMANSWAEEVSGFNVFPAIGYYNPVTRDDEIEDDLFYSLGLGYKFSPRWSTELTYLNFPTEDASGDDFDMEALRLEALYHLEQYGNLQPFVALGLAHNEIESELFSDSATDTQLHLGTGFKVFFNETISWRTDVRLINSFDYDEVDFAISTGINFFFGKTASKPAPAPVKRPSRIDSDYDGVLDVNDACSNTVKGAQVDSKGCPLDEDNDGVFDYKDECLDSAPNTKVNDQGCYVVLKEKREVNLEVNFANDSDVVPEAYYGEIKEVADFMQEYPLSNVVIEGHTDDRGAASYNESLSDRRAKNVAAVLVREFGISAERVSAKGYGESQPIASNDTPQGRAANRRVVAVVSGQ